MTKFVVRARSLCLVAVSIAATGCSTMRGAPKPFVSEDVVPKAAESAQTQLRFLSGEASGALGTCDLATERNPAILKVLAFVDLRYLTFRNDVIADGKHTKAAASGVTLAADIAASLTGSVGVKDNYRALSQLVQGSETIFDKEYLYQRTLDALVARMDASRRAKLVEIRDYMRLPVSEYPCESAIADILDYYYAGTINGAISEAQKSAAEDQAQSTRELKLITRAPSAEEVRLASTNNERIGKFVAGLKTADLARLKAFLEGKDVPVEASTDEDSLRVELRKSLNEFLVLQHFRDFPGFEAALKAEKFDIPK